MRKLKSKTWQSIKLIAIQWTIFALLVASAVLWFAQREYKQLAEEMAEKSNRLELCQENFKEFEKQIKSGQIILNLEE